ncbi:MAG: rRNA (cytosine967-C5)-methyltransferase [Candidatus Sumerlaeota bacterium]|nr:rRNA (cytosine967-C5)-methyltransferase [Candidatus Sumerlaeota bacterium]
MSVPPGRPASPARRAALDASLRARNPRTPGLDILVEESCVRAGAAHADAALAREIAYGVARHRLWLEHLLAQRVERPLAEFAPGVHETLLAGIFQHVFLDRIPAHALVDESVRLAVAQKGGERLRGLVNAVMRRITEQAPEDLRPHHDAAWRLRCSVPDLVAAEVVAAIGEERAEAFFAAAQETAPLCLRLRGDLDAVRAEILAELPQASGEVPSFAEGRLTPECFSIRQRGFSPDQLTAFREGRCTVEDEGAQAACLLALGNERPARVLDLCAAPGGKTAHLADILPGAALTACDVSERKLARLRQTLERLGLAGRTNVSLSEPILGTEQNGGFGFVLVDAPCSGLGTLRRHPEIRHRRSEEDFENLARCQYDLLHRAARLVDPGGVLAYTVCTVGRRECEAVVDRFLVLHPEFASAPETGAMPFDAGAVAAGPGCWRLLTNEWGCDGFFVARFRRIE